MSGSDDWSDIQAIKSRQSSLRAKMLQRRKEREGIAAEITKSTVSPTTAVEETKVKSETSSPVKSSPSSTSSPVKVLPTSEPTKIDPVVEKKVMLLLCDIDIPCNSAVIADQSSKALKQNVKLNVIEEILKKLAGQKLINITVKDESEDAGQSKIEVNSLDISKLSVMSKDGDDTSSKKRKHDGEITATTEEPAAKQSKVDDSIESLLSMESAKEKENKKLNEEILELLTKPTAKEQILVQRFKSQGGAQLKEFCQYGTREECFRLKETSEPCKRLHFRKIINKHTDESLGDCSFLNTCFHMDTCKYVHYEIEYPAESKMKSKELSIPKKSDITDVQMFPPQWIQCDLRHFDMSVLGKCAVVMADPPWDIHMELPYGTMQDDEMRKLDVPSLQDEGYLFLWVTGRAMELGRECLDLWGYKRIDEVIWVKTNQLQRIIRTGRTGHWLNHGKEHCLVGVKGNLKGVNQGLDCDVIVAEVRATSHKPDEIYGIIERLSPGTRKVELFGRPHNVQPNWITLGNQTEGVRLKDPDIVARFKERYPDGNCMEPPKPRT